MSSYVPAALRKSVEQRAEGLCEYCLIHEDDSFLGCEIEHIISEKHGGQTDETNLAMACVYCNRAKGSDIATLLPDKSTLCRLFHPRVDRWLEHFRFEGVRIIGITDVGKATVALLQLNHPERLEERDELRMVNRFPSPSALRRINFE